jgi:hypothetical protein
MAITITKKFQRQETSHAAPFGNAWLQTYTFETNSSGYFLNSDTPGAAVWQWRCGSVRHSAGRSSSP